MEIELRFFGAQKRNAQLQAAQAEMCGHQDQATDLSAAHEDLAHQVGRAAHSRSCSSAACALWVLGCRAMQSLVWCAQF